MFLDALSDVMGQTQSKQLLLQHARSAQQLTKLQTLGMLLGIQEWTDSFQSSFVFPQNCVEAVPLDMGLAVQVNKASCTSVKRTFNYLNICLG